MQEKKAFTSPALGKKTKPYPQVEILFVLWDKYSENYKKGHCKERRKEKRINLSQSFQAE